MDFDQLLLLFSSQAEEFFARRARKFSARNPRQQTVAARTSIQSQAPRSSAQVRREESAGEVLFEVAEKLLPLRDESIQVVADRGTLSRDRSSSGANEATCLYLLPDIFAEFQRRLSAGAHQHLAQTQTTKSCSVWQDGSVDVRHRHPAHQVSVI